MFISILAALTVMNPISGDHRVSFPPFENPMIWNVNKKGSMKQRFLVEDTQNGKTWSGKLRGFTSSSTSSSNFVWNKKDKGKIKYSLKLTHPISGEKLKLFTRATWSKEPDNEFSGNTWTEMTIKDQSGNKIGNFSNSSERGLVITGKLDHHHLAVEKFWTMQEKTKDAPRKVGNQESGSQTDRSRFAIRIDGKIAAWFERIRTYNPDQPYVLYLDPHLDEEIQNKTLTTLMIFHLMEGARDNAASKI